MTQNIFELPTITHEFETEEQWLDLRAKKTWITSTEVASIKGCGFVTPNEVFEAKMTGYRKKVDNDILLAWGQEYEHLVANMMKKVYGLFVEPNKVFQTRGVLAASYDYVITGIDEDAPKMLNIPKDIADVMAKGKRVNCEIKYVSPLKWNEEWEGKGLPAKYFYQTQTQMFVDGQFEDTFVFTFYGFGLEYRHVGSDKFIQEGIYEDAETFINEYIVKETPPPADYAKDTEVIKYRVKNNYAYDGQKNAPAELIEEYFKNKEDGAALKKKETALKNEILAISKLEGLYDGYEIKIDKRGAISIKKGK